MTWNGWLRPSLTHEVADQLAADLAKTESQALDEHRILVRWKAEMQAYVLQSAEYARRRRSGRAAVTMLR